MGLCVILSAIIGYARGLSRQVVKIITVVISAVAAFFASSALFNPFVNWLNSFGIEGIVERLNITLDETTREMILSASPDLLVRIAVIPYTLVAAPVLFVVLYALFALLTSIIHKLLCGAFGFTRRNNNIFTRFGGLAVGAVQGLFVAILILVPFCGVINTAHVAVIDANEEQPESEYTTFLSSAYGSYFSELDANPIYTHVANLSVMIYEKYSNVELYGDKVDMTEVASECVGIYVATADFDGANFMALRDQDKKAIDKIVENAIDSDYMSSILADSLSAFSRVIEIGAYELELPDHEKVRKLINDIVIILGTTSDETVADDIVTFKNVYYLLSDGGVLTAANEEGSEVFSLFTQVDASGKTLMSRLNDELVKNPRTHVLCTDMADVAMALLLTNSGMSETITPETLDNVKGSLNDVIAMDKDAYETEEEYKAAVSNTIGTTLDECHIALEPEQLDIVTDYVIQEFEGKEEVTDEDMVNFMSQYYDAYASGELEVPAT